ncbi:MAG: hypothetical protein IT321_25220 [Anaerolineae bacterium]|nr:hypothetical protein [Anaerolineae bacterium]
MMTIKRLAQFTGLLLVVSLALAVQRVSSQVTPDVTPLAPEVQVAAQMDFAPDDCGILPEPMAIDPLIPQAIGAWPLWVAVPNAGEASKAVLFVPNEHYQQNKQLEGWWSTKVGWFISPSYVGDVQVSAYNLADDSPIFFDAADELAATMTLNPAVPGGFVEGLDAWAFFPSNLWVSKAGCYRLEARWEGGLWQQVIAVGSLDL